MFVKRVLQKQDWHALARARMVAEYVHDIPVIMAWIRERTVKRCAHVQFATAHKAKGLTTGSALLIGQFLDVHQTVNQVEGWQDFAQPVFLVPFKMAISYFPCKDVINHN
jgi:hypothetical protein